MIKNKYTYLAAVVLCATAATIIALAVAPNGKSDTWPFTTVSPAQLASDGVTLDSPQAGIPSAAVSASVAEADASAALGNAAVREEHYMHCVDAQATNPSINQDCYVVSVDPSNIPIEGSSKFPVPAPMKWAVVLIDPATGNVIEEKASNR